MKRMYFTKAASDPITLAMDDRRERLRARIAELRAEQRRLNWLGGAGAIVAIAAWIIFGMKAMLGCAIPVGSVFFVGHYVMYMHIYETRVQLTSPTGRSASRS